jgi:hypothetical protein
MLHCRPMYEVSFGPEARQMIRQMARTMRAFVLLYERNMRVAANIRRALCR